MNFEHIKKAYCFDKQVVLITGGASGMGYETAKQFNDLGANVFIIDTNPPTEKHEKILFFECDVSNYEKLHITINKIANTAGRIDHLFTNAGILLSAQFVDSSIEKIDHIIKTNVNGTIYTLKCVLPVMIKQNSGSIVLMGSDQSLIGKSGNSLYGCTKAAIAQLAKSLAIEHANHHIRINCVCPGTIETPFTKTAVTNYSKKTGIPEQDIYNELANAQPIKRMGSATEVANLVVFLCSSLATYITGSLYSVDGGYTAQ